MVGNEVMGNTIFAAVELCETLSTHEAANLAQMLHRYEVHNGECVFV